MSERWQPRLVQRDEVREKLLKAANFDAMMTVLKEA